MLVNLTRATWKSLGRKTPAICFTELNLQNIFRSRGTISRTSASIHHERSRGEWRWRNQCFHYHINRQSFSNGIGASSASKTVKRALYHLFCLPDFYFTKARRNKTPLETGSNNSWSLNSIKKRSCVVMKCCGEFECALKALLSWAEEIVGRRKLLTNHTEALFQEVGWHIVGTKSKGDTLF